VAVVQQAREPELQANRDKIVRFIARARARGCRLVIFPEDALGSPVGTSNEHLEKAVDVIRNAARSNDVYAIFCSSFVIPGFAPDRRGQCLHVVGPDGRILLRFNKLICNLPRSDPRKAPGVFHVDGISCCAMICADRWLRGFEELPVTLGAKILIDCSANARKEWIPEFAWYLPVTRALRNNVFPIFCNMGQHPQGRDEPRHGHSAIIQPDGAFAAAADDAGDRMLVATLDLSKAHAAEARRRHNHPVFKPYWDLGRRISQGESAHITRPTPYVSSRVNSQRNRSSRESRIQRNRAHWAGVDFVPGLPEYESRLPGRI
jgi:predicted amidohydrolase